MNKEVVRGNASEYKQAGIGILKVNNSRSSWIVDPVGRYTTEELSENVELVTRISKIC